MFSLRTGGHLTSPMTGTKLISWGRVTSRERAVRFVSAGVKLPTYADLKFPSLWVVAGHYVLPNFTPLRMLSVWFQPTEGTEVIT